MPTREELIKICEDAVVHYTKWENRYSFIAQKKLQSIYEGLTAGLEYKILYKEDRPDYHSDESTFIIEFIQPIDFEKLEKNVVALNISSREQYFKDLDPDYNGEIFDGDGIDFESGFTISYMPTRKRLDDVKGGDWY